MRRIKKNNIPQVIFAILIIIIYSICGLFCFAVLIDMGCNEKPFSGVEATPFNYVITMLMGGTFLFLSLMMYDNIKKIE